jgi:hypothetical protein
LTPLDPDVAFPESRMPPSYRRWLSVLVGIAALCVAVFSWIEANSGRQEEQAFVRASRSALDTFAKLAASAPRTQFEGNAFRRAIVVRAEGTGRVVATPIGGELFEASQAQSRADNRAGRRLREIAEQMSAAPAEGDELDPNTLEAVGISSPTAVLPLVEGQNEAVDDASKYGTRQERSFFSLGLVASAAALLGLAGLMGASRAGRISLVTAAVALFAAILWTATAFV